MLPAAPTADLVRQRRWVTPEPLNVAPTLVGLPLATPRQRGLAMAVDLGAVALLSGATGFWLFGGLILVLLQLRSQRGAATPRRMVVGWVLAALLASLAVQEAVDQWQHRGGRSPATSTADDEEAEPAPAKSASAIGALPADPASSTSTAVAGDPATAASAAQSEIARLNSRVSELEGELAQARKPKPLSVREQLDSLLEAAGTSFGWGIVYFSLLPAFWGGQTLGKKLFGLQVVELTGKPVTVMVCLRRYGGYAAGMATGGLGLLQLLWDVNRQAIQDRSAHTVVVDLRAPRRTEAGETSEAVATDAVAH